MEKKTKIINNVMCIFAVILLGFMYSRLILEQAKVVQTNARIKELETSYATIVEEYEQLQEQLELHKNFQGGISIYE